MPRNQHHPTPAERDERVKVDLPPDEAIKLIMETGESAECQPQTDAESSSADSSTEGV
jgi:hypothetical protein